VRPLQDIRVLDLTRLLPGPFASLVLADLGASVDKIEDAGGGDYLRHMVPAVAGECAAFQLLNRGKRSAVLDLKKPDAKAAFLRLVRSYDVLFEQFRPGVLDRLGLGHDVLRRENPRLVVCALTGYGQTGVLAQRAGHDINYLARSGLLGAQGPVASPPQVPATQLADISGGLWSVIAIQGALRERDRTGQGCVLDIAMVDGILPFATMAIAAALAGEAPRRGDDHLSGGIAAYQTYFSKDGHPMSLGALEPKFWMSFCAGAGIDPSMEGLMPGPHQPALKAKVAAAFAERTRAEWEAFAAERDCCLEPVIAPSELTTDPHLTSRALFSTLPTPRGPVPQLRLPITPRDAASSPPPRKGEHTRAILRDAGLEDEEIATLLQTGAARED
jgi:alpha-methylacyl-CoA racemase